MSSDATVTLVDKDHGWVDFEKSMKQAGDGVFADVGLFDDDMDPEDIYKKGLVNEFGDDSQNIPERSWIRSTFDENEKAMIAAIIQDIRKADDMDLPKTIEELGDMMVLLFKRKVEHMRSPPNAPATIRKKGFDDPLIETREMVESIAKRMKTANPATSGE